MRTRRPTRDDVAQKAGVAPSTVTLILKGRGDELKIPKSTQDRVKEAARTIGYYPNPHISAVLRGRSGIIGLYLRPDQWRSPAGYWSAVLWHLQCAFAATDVELLIHCAPEGSSTEDVFAKQAGSVVDGVIILNSGSDPIVGRLIEAGIPAVEVGDFFSHLPFVAVDGVSGVHQAMAHLSERGYKKPGQFLYITNYVENSQARHSAYLEDASNLFAVDGSRYTRTVENGMDGFRVYMEMEDKPDCFLCPSDEFAYELMSECHKAGIRVPEDLALVGFDGIPTISVTKRVTTIETPLREMATQALQKVRDIIDDKPIEKETHLPVNLRVGSTT